MKKGILPLLLLIIFIAPSYGEYNLGYLSGKYYDEYGEDIKVKVRRNRLRIKGLPGHRGYDEFRPYAFRKWMDKRGNTVRLNRNGTLTYHNRRRRFRIDYDRSRFRNEFRYRDRSDEWYDYRNNNHGRHREDVYYERNKDFRDSFSGRWYNRGLDQYVVIERTRNGLRARLESSREWINFNRNELNEYVDRKGNKYIVNGNKNLIWVSFNGLRKLELTRK